MASVDYIQRLKASEGAAFVSSTQEWKRRALSPAAAPLPAGARPPANVSEIVFVYIVYQTLYMNIVWEKG